MTPKHTLFAFLALTAPILVHLLFFNSVQDLASKSSVSQFILTLPYVYLGALIIMTLAQLLQIRKPKTDKLATNERQIIETKSTKRLTLLCIGYTLSVMAIVALHSLISTIEDLF